MNRVFTIGHNELRLFLKNRTSYVWLFLMPLAFVYFMSFAARDGGRPGNRVPPVLIENLDTGFLGSLLIDEMAAQGLWRVDPSKGEKAQRGIRLPADFTSQVLAGKRAKVEFYTVQGSGSADAAIIEARLVRALVRFNSQLLETLTHNKAPSPLTAETLRVAREKTELVTLQASFAGRRPQPTGFNFSLPGNLVMYLMMNLLIFGGTTIADARRNGVLRRLMMMPVRRWELIGGLIYGLILLGAAQIAAMLVFGKFIFGVNLGANLPGVILVLLAFSWVAASLGVLIGSVLNAPDRVVGVCVLSSLLMAAIGGCWWPLEVAPQFAQYLAKAVPTGWALQALHQLISFGSGLDAVVMPLLVVLAFGAVANLAAARWFRV